MEGIDSVYKLSWLLSGRGGSSDTVVNLAIVEIINYKISVVRSQFGTHSYAISLLVIVSPTRRAIECQHQKKGQETFTIGGESKKSERSLSSSMKLNLRKTSSACWLSFMYNSNVLTMGAMILSK